MDKGDYVFATKYSDGDPADGWAVGFYDGILNETTHKDRHMVVDEEGNQFRRNGFRKVEKISQEIGDDLIRNLKKFDYHPDRDSCHQDAWGLPVEVNLWDVLESIKQKLALTNPNE